MRGRSKFKKPVLRPDEKYNSQKIAKFINYLMQDGKKSLAKSIVYKSLEGAAKELKTEPLAIMDQAVENTSPLLEVKPRRIGGATYLVPIEVKPSRRMTLAMREIIKSARNKQGKPMVEFLAQELKDAYNNTGSAVAKRDELHKMAEANKAFAHYAKF